VDGLNDLPEVLEGERVRDELRVWLHDGGVGRDRLHDVKAEPLYPPRQPVAIYERLWDHVPGPHLRRDGVEADAEEAPLLPAQLVVPFDEPSAKHWAHSSDQGARGIKRDEGGTKSRY